jgi:hypothetical protein
MLTNNASKGKNSLRSTRFLSHHHPFHVLVLEGLISFKKVIRNDTWPKLFRWYLFSLVLKPKNSYWVHDPYRHVESI